MFKRIPIIIIIVIVLLTACAEPPASPTATDVPTRTMTTLPTATSYEVEEEPTAALRPTGTPEDTATPEPTPTVEPTAEPTLEPTATPEILRPTESIDTLIPEGSPLREDFYQMMKTQFENGGLQLENGHYTLFCIAPQDMYRHEPFIELPDGSVVTHSIPCQYFDAEGSEQIVFIPAVRFKDDEKLSQFVGFQPVINNPSYEAFRDKMFYGATKDIGPVRFIEEHGYVGAGHPFTLHFGPVEPDQIQAFASEVQGEVQAKPEVFAGLGDPADLYQQLLFPWTQVGFRNNYVRYVK